MALNRSLGTSGMVKKPGSTTATKASAIPSATKVLKPSETSSEILQKAMASQPTDGGRLTNGISPKQKSSARERRSIPGRTVSSTGETNPKPGMKMLSSASQATPQGFLSTSGTGVVKPLTKVTTKDRSGRSSPKLHDLGGAGRPELPVSMEQCPAEVVALPSLLPLSLPSGSSKVDRTSLRTPNGTVAQPKPQAVALSSGKRSSTVSLNTKIVNQSTVTKGRSPPSSSLSSAAASEANLKAELQKVRKATGIAKLQNPPAMSRPLGGTNPRVTMPSARVSGSSRSGADVSVSSSVSVKDRESARRDSRLKKGRTTDKPSNHNRHTSSMTNQRKLGTIDSHKQRSATNPDTSETDRNLINSLRDTISKNFEDAVENVSECEYFSETRSTMSENLSEFGDGGLHLDSEQDNYSDMKRDMDRNSDSLNVSMDDIYASCEDIVGSAENNKAVLSGNANFTGNSGRGLVPSKCDNEDIACMNSPQEICLNDHNLVLNEEETELFVYEGTVDHDLQITEDDREVNTEKPKDDLSEHCTVLDNIAELTETLVNDGMISETLANDGMISETLANDSMITETLANDSLISESDCGKEDTCVAGNDPSCDMQLIGRESCQNSTGNIDGCPTNCQPLPQTDGLGCVETCLDNSEILCETVDEKQDLVLPMDNKSSNNLSDCSQDGRVESGGSELPQQMNAALTASRVDQQQEAGIADSEFVHKELGLGFAFVSGATENCATDNANVGTPDDGSILSNENANARTPDDDSILSSDSASDRTPDDGSTLSNDNADARTPDDGSTLSNENANDRTPDDHLSNGKPALTSDNEEAASDLPILLQEHITSEPENREPADDDNALLTGENEVPRDDDDPVLLSCDEEDERSKDAGQKLSIPNGFGADGIAVSEAEASSSGSIQQETDLDSIHVDTAAAAAAAAAGGWEDKDSDKIDEDDEEDDDDGPSSADVLGNSCETLTCEGESDVDVEAGKESEGVSASGFSSCCSESDEMRSTDRTNPDSESSHADSAKEKSANGDTDEPRKSPAVEEASAPSGDRSGGLLLSVLRGGILRSDNYSNKYWRSCDVDCANKSDTKISDNSAANRLTVRQQATKVALTGARLSSATGQLSSSFIKEFSVWLPESVAESDESSHVPGVDVTQLKDAHKSDSAPVPVNSSSKTVMNAKGTIGIPSINAMDVRPPDLRDLDRGKDKLRKREKNESDCEVWELSYPAPVVLDDCRVWAQRSSDLSANLSAGQRGNQRSSELAVPQNASSPATCDSFRSSEGSQLTNASAPGGRLTPLHRSSNKDLRANDNVPRAEGNLVEVVARTAHSAETSCVNTPKSKGQTCANKEETSLPQRNRDDAEIAVLLDATKKSQTQDLGTMQSYARKSLPVSLSELCFGASTKVLDSSTVHPRAPSPLRVLTDRCCPSRSGASAKVVVCSQSLTGARSTVPCEILPSSASHFHPITTVKDYFPCSTNSPLSLPCQNGEKAADETDKVMKDSNENVVGTGELSASTIASTSAEVHLPVLEIQGFMSPRYVPSRPLSQICSRTMGRSLRKNMGCKDEDSSCPTSVESLPAVDSVEGQSDHKSTVSAQIRFARSCSRIGLKSPCLTVSEGVSEHAGSTPRLPVAGSLPSFEHYRSTSGRTLAPRTSFSMYSQTDSSCQSLCSTPVIGEGASPCATPTRSSGLESSYLIGGETLRVGTSLSRRHTLDADVHGSFTSLASASSSIYSSTDEKQAIEMRKLRLELEGAKETIVSLKTQLNVNALMSKTYEQNIDGLTQRLKQLTTIIEQKESELFELRMALKNMVPGAGGNGGGLQTIPDCVGLNSSFHRKASNSASLPYDARSSGLKYLPVLTRHISCESVNSLNSQSSSCSMGSQQSATLFSEKKKKKKNWIRSSFSKAFSRKKNKPESAGEADTLSLQSDNSTNEPPLVVENHTIPATKNSPPEGHQAFPAEGSVIELEERLREADTLLTDLRLDALASVQHIEQLNEMINCLEQQVTSLKAENKNLQRLLLQQGTSAATSSPNNSNTQKRASDLVRRSSLRSTSPGGVPIPSSYSADGLVRLNISSMSHDMPSPKLLQRFSLVDAMASDASCEQLRRICVFVSEDSFCRTGDPRQDESTAEKASRQIGVFMLPEQANWQELDIRISNLFVEHIHNLDPEAGLGLNERSIASYKLGSQDRVPNSKCPDSLPSKLLPAANASIKIRLRDWRDDSVDFLAFDTLVPKPLLHQYVSLLLEKKRLLFCGPNLSGKTFLAKKLARHLVLRKDKRLSSISVAHFTVDSKSSKELQQYLSNIVSHCEQASDRLPTVIVIDNLHLADNLSKAFSGFFSLDSQLCPYLIGTMTQSRAASITCLQFHQNFRWVLFGVSDEPVKSFLARYLHRQWAERQFRRSVSEDGDCGLLRVVDWMPKVWHHINRFVASVCCPDKCIGPGIFLHCPVDVEKARTWFIDLWNYSIAPYLLQLIKDSSIQSGNSKSVRDDPTDWVLETSPWENGKGKDAGSLPLLRLYPYHDASSKQEQNQVLTAGTKQFLPHSPGLSDPLLDMLLHLHVATCYAECNTTATSNVPGNSFSGLSVASSKLSPTPNTVHSAAT